MSGPSESTQSPELQTSTPPQGYPGKSVSQATGTGAAAGAKDGERTIPVGMMAGGGRGGMGPGRGGGGYVYQGNYNDPGYNGAYQGGPYQGGPGTGGYNSYNQQQGGYNAYPAGGYGGGYPAGGQGYGIQQGYPQQGNYVNGYADGLADGQGTPVPVGRLAHNRRRGIIKSVLGRPRY